MRNVLLDTVLLDPKSNTAIDRLALLALYINAARAVNEAEDQLGLLKLTYAVYPEELTVTPVIVTPPAVYPVPVISLVLEYAVVLASSDAFPVYNAIFNVSVVRL